MIAPLALVITRIVGPVLTVWTSARRVEPKDASVEDRSHRLNRAQYGEFARPTLGILGPTRSI
ncbi:hypothetical protein [Natrinema halophilum]|uniref:Uncharacterized protein n=1 Tax=Natrinema halophilum TaxID=1699371 RepID=A0A7D5KTN0_9EURY|nr:hypothetical protein [Natrinema halophilum]QLG50704.1 hypothetical protein HYG82_18610 [Natrinema halophilum]